MTIVMCHLINGMSSVNFSNNSADRGGAILCSSYSTVSYNGFQYSTIHFTKNHAQYGEAIFSFSLSQISFNEESSVINF